VKFGLWPRPREKQFVPPGHFYSPICNPAELRNDSARIWRDALAQECPGIDLRPAAQLALLSEFSTYTGGIQFPTDATDDPTQYFYLNGQFGCLDAEVLFCMLRRLQPKAMFEIGSGYSTLVAAEVNRRFLDSSMNLTCIEPFPRPFLTRPIEGLTSLLETKVQQVDLSRFETLAANDVLFVDSSHVTKTGSDVNHIVFEILPRLNQGVYIHFHDIFLPDDYPIGWAIDENRSWNEQYLLRAFLQYNERFTIRWNTYFMMTRYLEETYGVFPRFNKLWLGGSLWLQKS
jgi:Methyltransferase domain